jgi:hypothetical protein
MSIALICVFCHLCIHQFIMRKNYKGVFENIQNVIENHFIYILNADQLNQRKGWKLAFRSHNPQKVQQSYTFKMLCVFHQSPFYLFTVVLNSYIFCFKHWLYLTMSPMTTGECEPMHRHGQVTVDARTNHPIHEFCLVRVGIHISLVHGNARSRNMFPIRATSIMKERIFIHL